MSSRTFVANIKSKNALLSARADHVFNAVAKALDSGVLHGNTLHRVVLSTKNWLSILPPDESQRVFNNVAPDTRETVQRYFA